AQMARTDYGWQMQMVGDRCYVRAVKPGSDAEAKGIKPGHEVEEIDGRVPTRDNLWLVQYLYYALRPQPGMHLLLKTPAGERRKVDAMARVQSGKRVVDLTLLGTDFWDLIREAQAEDHLRRHRYIESANLSSWTMPQFAL